MSEAPIGIFDSGVGGLSILRHIRQQLPYENCIYFADQAHLPYGSKTAEQVVRYSQTITHFLIQRGAKIIVVSCNTASAASLEQLRVDFPEVPIVGMEPAVKPAIKITKSGKIGVLATPVTFLGKLFADKVKHLDRDIEIHNRTLPGLVELIEAGELDGPQARSILEEVLSSLLNQGVDTLVLACTHYPLVLPLIRQIAPPSISIIDPSPAIARQTGRVLQEAGQHNTNPEPGKVIYSSSTSADELAAAAMILIGEAGDPLPARWQEGDLVADEAG